MSIRLTLAVLSALSLAGLAPRADDPTPFELAALSGTDLRTEHFVLRRKTTDAKGRTTAEVAGFVEWRRREAQHGVQLECDTRFLRGQLAIDGARDAQRVLHVECLTDTSARCVWRELGPGSGRSIQGEWSRDGGSLDIAEWSPSGTKKGTLVAAKGVVMPLYLTELVRHGRVTAGTITEFDPLARTLEPLTVRTLYLEGSALAGPDHEGLEHTGTGREDAGREDAAQRAEAARSRSLRTVEFVRADGTLAGRYRFAGVDLVAFQWQEGGLFGQRVDAEEYARLFAENAPRLAEDATGEARPAAIARDR
jgi:hypothetical protein